MTINNYFDFSRTEERIIREDYKVFEPDNTIICRVQDKSGMCCVGMSPQEGKLSFDIDYCRNEARKNAINQLKSQLNIYEYVKQNTDNGAPE